jgi:hypothetical protein
MSIVNQQVSSDGIGPVRLDVVDRFVAYPKASGTANAFSITLAAASTNSTVNSTTTTGAGSTLTTRETAVTWATFASASQHGTGASATQPDYARNLAYSVSNSALSTQFSSGLISVSGSDQFGVSGLLETIALSGLISTSSPSSGSANFRFLQSALANITFVTGLSYTSRQTSDSNGGTTTGTGGTTLAPALTVRIGVGQKLGLPCDILRSGDDGLGNNIGGVIAAKLNSVDQTTTGTFTSGGSTLTSIAPLFTVTTGPYRTAGVVVSALASNSLLEVEYKLNGFI